MKKVIKFKLKVDEEGFHRYEIVQLENIPPTRHITVSIPRLDKSDHKTLDIFITNILEEEDVEALYKLMIYEMVFIK